MADVPSTYPPKVIVTKIGFDGHDRGSRLVAAFLRDAGMEVIYTPPWQEVSTVVKLVIEEDAEVIGISSLATDHLSGAAPDDGAARSRRRRRAGHRRWHRAGAR